MSQRYRKIFELPHNLYSEGCPAVVSAGVLSIDSQSGNVFIQLKIKNISPKTIIAAYVEITTLSVSGDVINEAVGYSYLDLNCARGEEFGSKTPLTLPDNRARSFSVRFTKFVFSDNSVTNISTFESEPIPESKKLKEIYDADCMRRLAEISNPHCNHIPFEYKDLRICSCTTVLHSNEEFCWFCGVKFNSLYKADPNELKKDGIYSLACQTLAEADAVKTNYKADTVTTVKNAAFSFAKQESMIYIHSADIDQKIAKYDSARTLFESISDWKDSAENIELCKDNAEQLSLDMAKRKETCLSETAAMKQKIIHGAKIGAIALGVIIIFSILNKFLFTPLSMYNDAIDSAEQGRYRTAYSILNDLGDFKDSPEKIIELKNQEAQEYISIGNYTKGYEILEEIGNLDAIKESKLQRGIKHLEEEDYDSAYSILTQILGYKNSAELINESKYTRGKAYITAGDFEQGYELLDQVATYKDSATIVKESKYTRAVANFSAGEFVAAYALFDQIPDYKDAKAIVDKSRYERGMAFLAAEDFKNAYDLLEKCVDYADTKKTLSNSRYARAEAFVGSGDYKSAAPLYEKVEAEFYPDAPSKYETYKTLADAQAKYGKGNYKDALELCEKIKGNSVADNMASSCHSYISRIESYCGTYTGTLFGDEETITVSYNYSTQEITIFSGRSYMKGSAKFDLNNPGKKYNYKSYGDSNSYYFQFISGQIRIKLHDSSDIYTFTKEN